MKKKELGISCPVFLRQEIVIKDITAEINRVKRAREKAAFAEELQRETNVLVTCPDYDDKKLDCKNCRFIADLRKKTAGLIIKLKS
ncbi:MAG: hypothetical protein L6420_02430 [Elusimicrobia bacterium]|nr:hypothetical protein [Elusimicrobiota bacterium]